MIVLFTDYGLNGPYLGQVRNVLHRDAPGVPVIDLFANAPAYDPKPAAYLLSAFCGEFPPGAVFFAVVDPGVGGERQAGVLEADGRWYVGPDNGLFEIIIRHAASEPQWWDILWRPERLSATFHGRDLFAPITARLARGEAPEGPDFRERPLKVICRPDWPDDLSEIIYLDDFGNAMTGLRYGAVPEDADISVAGRPIPRAETFSDVPEGAPFCYENSNGLLEIAVNRGRADGLAEITLGRQVAVSK
ncbi:MAG: SAM-dependent chlorinase/fluorinase [Rhodospirillales bacterium]|nr:SAM-dependent chlorinase/fluorinase [Alphaproteobacteria bacterium]MBL6948515.1 SAM-dependent chlorinase/fluorinase [Rhodospirillales bacterium]